MRNIIFLIFLLFIFNSCSDELITIVDEYNPPYDIKAIPDENGTTVSISFWSGVLADDFAGFNLYANISGSFTQPTDAIQDNGNLPTVRVETHTRSNFTLTFPSSSIQANTVNYITVTAYGTNDLAEGSRIETKINTIIPVFPRRQENGTVTPNTSINAGSLTATINNNTITAAGYQVKSYGYQTNFNAITVFTNNNTSSTVPYSVGWLYIFSNGTTLTKVWITSDTACTYATHSQAGNGCNTI